MRCAAHPDVETNLTCGKCGRPICPKCLVQTPVGARCPACAKMSRIPTYRVTTQYYLRAVIVGLVTAIICGLIWGFIERLTFFYLNLVLAPAAGYAISEAINISVNRKRGTGLAVVAGLEVLVSYLVSILCLRGLAFQPLDALALALGIFVSVHLLR